MAKLTIPIEVDWDSIKDNIIKYLEDNNVVEVVRCRDCKHWNRDDEYCVDFLTQDKNGFCSWGERREDGEIC